MQAGSTAGLEGEPMKCPKCKSEKVKFLYADGHFEDTDVFECQDCKKQFLRKQGKK